MANTLTPFVPDLFQALDEVSRELVGFIPSVALNASAARAALNESVQVPIAPAFSSVSIAPAMSIPEPDDFTEGSVAVAITKAKAVPFALNGEEYKGLDNGIGANTIITQNFKQCIRTLVNEVEVDVGTAAALGASRAYGPDTPADPFSSTIKDAAQIVKILDDNGAPKIDRSLVINSGAGLNLRGLSVLTNVDNAGTSMTLRQGELGDLYGFSVKESAGVYNPAVGTGAAITSKGSLAVGATTITLKSIDSGGILNGDYISIAGDTNRYLVVSGGAASLSANAEIVIAAPGLRVAHTDGQAITIASKAARNIGFTKSAIQLVTRAPALPGGKDQAVDAYMMVDPRSGLAFEIRVYEGYRKMRAEVALAWGVKVIKPEHIGCLLGLG